MAELNEKLITFAYFKKECDIPQNIPDLEIDSKVYQAQETLRMLMGDEFYQDYLLNYKNNTFTAVYTTLYGYVKQYVAWQTNEFWTVKANFKVTRSGFRVHTEENSVVATDIQMGSIIKIAKQQSQYYKKLLVDYLNGHSADYPLYLNNCHRSSTGNTFRISAIKNKHHKDCDCRRCR